MTLERKRVWSCAQTRNSSASRGLAAAAKSMFNAIHTGCPRPRLDPSVLATRSQLLHYGGDVEREDAYELANLWNDQPEVEQPGNAYERMTGAVRQFLPDDVRGSAGLVNGVPAVFAFDAESFYVIQSESSEEAPNSVLLAARYPVNPAETAVEVRDGTATDHRGQAREWTFAFGQRPPLTLRTYLGRNTGWPEDATTDSERFARELAGQLGWKAPFERKRQ